MVVRNQLKVLFAVLLLTVAAPAWAQEQVVVTEAPPAGQPRLELSTSEFNFGEIWEGTPAKGHVDLKNVGQAPLTIQAKSTCGCTVISSPKSPLAPGESTKLDISYDTARIGATRKRVRILTNDPQKPEAGVDVIGTVKAMFEVTPTRIISFKDLERDSVATQKLTLTNKYSQPIKLRIKERQSHPTYDVKLKEVEAGQKYELEITTVPPLAYGSNMRQLFLETGIEETPVFYLNMNAYVPAPASVSPPRVVITPDTHNPRSRTLRVKFRKDDPVKIVDVKVEPDTIMSKFDPTKTSPIGDRELSYEIHLSFPELDTLPKDGAKVTIITDSEPPYQTLTVPIMIRLGR